jgi:hypothetical protein
MPPMRPDDPPLPSASPLSADVAHVRTLLSQAGTGPEPTRVLVVDLIVSLIADGYLNSATWILAPSPLDDLGEVVFYLRSSADADSNHQEWRSNTELATVIAAARDLSARTETVEVWAGNGPGVRRLVLVGYDGSPVTYLLPEAGNFDGEESLVRSAVTDWRDHAADETALAQPIGPERATGPTTPETTETTDAPAAPAPGVPAPGVPAPGVPAPGANVVSDAETFAHAVQEALNHLSVEVELGSIEELVLASVRTALAELPALTTPSEDEPRPALGASQLADVAHDLRQAVDESVRSAVFDALSHELPAAMEHFVAASPAAAPPAAAIPAPIPSPRQLDALVQRSVAHAVEESLTRLLPGLVDQAMATSALALSPETARDPVIEYARRNMQPLDDEVGQHPSAPDDGRPREATRTSSPKGKGKNEAEGEEPATLHVLRSDEIR